MKVEVDGKMYCVETLIFDNERLRKEVVASAELHRLILDYLRAEIDGIEINGQIDEHTLFARSAKEVKNMVLEIIDKYRTVKGANE